MQRRFTRLLSLRLLTSAPFAINRAAISCSPQNTPPLCKIVSVARSIPHSHPRRAASHSHTPSVVHVPSLPREDCRNQAPPVCESPRGNEPAGVRPFAATVLVTALDRTKGFSAASKSGDNVPAWPRLPAISSRCRPPMSLNKASETARWFHALIIRRRLLRHCQQRQFNAEL